MVGRAASSHGLAGAPKEGRAAALEISAGGQVETPRPTRSSSQFTRTPGMGRRRLMQLSLHRSIRYCSFPNAPFVRAFISGLVVATTRHGRAHSPVQAVSYLSTAVSAYLSSFRA